MILNSLWAGARVGRFVGKNVSRHTLVKLKLARQLFFEPAEISRGFSRINADETRPLWPGIWRRSSYPFHPRKSAANCLT